MKTITNEVKARVFAQYYGQIIALCNEPNVAQPDTVDYCLKENHDNDYSDFDKWKLILTPLSKITDEDVTGVINMGMDEPYDQLEIESKDNDSVCFSFKPKRGGRISAIINYNELMFDSYQLLQSKGYAMPCLGYSVDDLSELGVYKLT